MKKALNTKYNIMEEINQELQPLVIVGTLGRVSNGKSTLIKALSGVNPMKFSKEMTQNMTIKLGYTNVKLYKCDVCLSFDCYQINKECFI